MSFEGKIAVVTGASRGIGKGIALELARAGAKVVCIATRKENAEETAAEISGTAFGLDVSDSSAVDRVFDEITKEVGPPSILVNNAGITRDGLVIRMKDEDWDQVINVNLKGAFLCSKSAIRAMMKSRWGRIVNISSIIGLAGAAGQVNYAASKAGIIGMTKAFAKEVGSRNITVNAIAPGFIETDMTEGLSEEMKQSVLSKAPISRLGTPYDIAATVRFLCSEDAGYITGQTWVVDGGLTL